MKLSYIVNKVCLYVIITNTICLSSFQFAISCFSLIFLFLYIFSNLHEYLLLRPLSRRGVARAMHHERDVP